MDVQGQVDGRILDIDKKGWRLLKTGQFSWTSYVYHPLLKSSSLHLYYLIKIDIFNLILANFFHLSTILYMFFSFKETRIVT